MNIAETFTAHQVAQIIAAQRRRSSLSPEQMRLFVECLDALPIVRADTATDALALLVVARQTIIKATDAMRVEDEIPAEEQAQTIEWAGTLIDRVVAMLEASSGIAAETFSGITPAMN